MKITIEASLRNRANRSRLFAIIWLTAAVVILIGTYFSLPFIAGKTLDAVFLVGRAGPNAVFSGKEALSGYLNAFALVALALSAVAIMFASYLLGRCAFVEMQSADRLRAIADALCICGCDFAQLERTITLFTPKAELVSGSKKISAEDLKDFVEVLSKIK